MQQELSERILEELEDLKERCVIVRVWTSTHKDGKLDSIGHISVETTNGHYMSLWPEDPHVGLKDTTKIFPAYFVKSLEEDASKAREGRLPEHTFFLYTLDVTEMNMKFERFKADPKGWTLAPIPGVTGEAESCVSLARKVLMAGNLTRLVSTFDRFKASVTGSVQASGKSSSAGALAAAYAVKSDKDASKFQSGESQVQLVRAIEHLMALPVDSPDAWVPVLEKAREYELRENNKIQLLESQMSGAVKMSRK